MTVRDVYNLLKEEIDAGRGDNEVVVETEESVWSEFSLDTIPVYDYFTIIGEAIKSDEGELLLVTSKYWRK